MFDVGKISNKMQQTLFDVRIFYT